MFLQKQIAELLEVDDIVAYGLLRFMAEKGCVQVGKGPKPEGRRGRAPTAYKIDREALEKLNTLLMAILVLPTENAVLAEEEAASAAFKPTEEAPYAEVTAEVRMEALPAKELDLGSVVPV